MPVYMLTNDPAFPDPALADPSGVLAVGGDLRPERVLLAYRHGIFPWYGEGDPILWWSPDPRFVLFPDELKVSASMQRVMKSGKFTITYDKDFAAVIRECRRAPRPGQKGTWITDEMLAAYARLFELGHAHSVEVWVDGKLVGGLYGIRMGRVFFGESMFHKISNASKAGLIDLVGKLKAEGCALIDCQVETKLFASLGARFISRKRYLGILKAGVALTPNGTAS
jgi:leucyl/phenylalanyl-tRNA--protein transferase